MYEGMERKSGERVAIKAIGLRGRELGEVWGEVSKQGMCESEYIARVYEAAVYGEHVLVVLEKGEGSDLRSLMGVNGALGEGRAARLTREILLGLKEVHERGLCHRDVKPENVMVSEGKGWEKAGEGMIGARGTLAYM